jgi:hypothetical protein
MTRAIAALLEIMSDTEAPLRRRIEAAEGLLAFEAPDEIVDQAKSFLAGVFEDSEQHVDTRLDALKLMRKAEARKVLQPTVSASVERDNLELMRKIEIGRRRMRMMKEGYWPPPPDWADDLLSPDYLPPWPSRTISRTTDGYAEALKRGRKR